MKTNIMSETTDR